MNNNLFKIDDSEKMRILEMHQSATSRHYLGEQVAPATTVAAPGPKDPSAFVRTVNDLKYGASPGDKLWFQSPKYPILSGTTGLYGGIAFTTQVTKSQDTKDSSGKVITNGAYNFRLNSEPLMIDFSLTCGGGTRLRQVLVNDKQTTVSVPSANNKPSTGDAIVPLVKNLFGVKGFSENNPFITEFKQQYCQS